MQFRLLLQCKIWRNAHLLCSAFPNHTERKCCTSTENIFERYGCSYTCVSCNLCGPPLQLQVMWEHTTTQYTAAVPLELMALRPQLTTIQSVSLCQCTATINMPLIHNSNWNWIVMWQLLRSRSRSQSFSKIERNRYRNFLKRVWLDCDAALQNKLGMVLERL